MIHLNVGRTTVIAAIASLGLCAGIASADQAVGTYHAESAFDTHDAPEAVLSASLASGRLDAEVAATLHATGTVDAMLVLRQTEVVAALESLGAGPEFWADAPVLDAPIEDASYAPTDDVTATPADDAAVSLDYDAWLAVSAEALAVAKQRVAAAMPTGFAVIEDYDNLPVQFVRFDSIEALAAALAHPAVELVDENRQFTLTLAQSLPLIGAPAAQAAGFTGAGRSVAVLDTGVDFTRAAFGPCRAAGVPATDGGTCRVTVARDFAPNDNSRDDSGHGTNVAGIVLGVAPRANILALDVFEWDDGEHLSSTADQTNALNWVIGNRNAHNIVAVNMSLGNDSHHLAHCRTSALKSVFARLRAVGILPIVSAGNNAVVDGKFRKGISSPACVPGAVSVGAVYDDNVDTQAWEDCTDATTAADQITCFSQSGPTLSVLAPGSRITAAGFTKSGTSMAAPHVAGAAAALASNCRNPTITRIGGAITGNGPRVPDARSGVTVRRLDLAAASRDCRRTVPDVVGDEAAAALRTLRSAGYSASPRHVVDPTCERIGMVIRQSPHRGTVALAASPVTIWVGTRPSRPCP